MLKIAVAGTGYVGLVTGTCLAERGHCVTCVDVDENKIKMMESGKSPIYEDGLEELMQKNHAAGRLSYTTDYQAAYCDADAIFIGVGTPELPDGSADLHFVMGVARQIAESVQKDCLVVVKSTVPIGTNDEVEKLLKECVNGRVNIEVASNPEFLAQGTAVRDTLNASRCVIGTESKNAESVMRAIYEPFGIPIVSVNRRSAEMIKYASNDFLALKISYMNDLANLCELVGADVKAVAQGMSYDERIGRRFLNPGIGYGGSCFPKDTKALRSLAADLGYELKTVSAAIEVNQMQQIRLFTKAEEMGIELEGKKIAILGLAFKAGTDDLREAASLKNVPLLLEKGANLVAYDPVAQDNFIRRFPEGQQGSGSIHYVHSAKEALQDADLCFVYTEWPEFVSLTPSDFIKTMKSPVVFDGRDIYQPEEMKNAGITYIGIGR
ncbi:MAG TPA: UDP-glucose/GDP-mannose dehydrogenase family protein [Lachnospiraceae bacterium]|nr:UDP-glucose/GDP-mannose dehydrogenase family protein [Lachnospiraceae bacterium]HPF29204.1 UDP-glucose/GDP-mannose dehydrogenase family protein [Lachnospiraceae bacterium]